jgi:hypothetical protein
MSAIVVAGDTSGSITIAAPAVAGSGTLTLPVATDTLIGKATTDTLTNKTLTSPVLTTPALGTPASGVLTNCTGVPAAALPAGSVLQVVNATYATQVSAATNTFVTTNLTATITPRSTSSKILVLAHVAGIYKTSGAALSVSLRLYRGASSIVGFEAIGGFNSAGAGSSGTSSTTYLDSPATTSATTYTVYFNSSSNAATAVVQAYNVTQADATSTITLMEIQG